MAKTVNQAISLDGSELYEVKGTNVYSGQVTMYDSLSGIGGQPFVPYDGATVYVASNELDALDTVRKFELSLNNKAYYLVSNVRFTEDQTQQLFDSATEIEMTYDGDLNRYVGSFVYNNPDNYPYLYLVWNYTCNAFDGTAYYAGEEANGKEIYVDFGSNYGFVSITIGIPEGEAGFTLEWNGSIVYDTGLSTSFTEIYLNKYLPVSEGIIRVYSENNAYTEFNITVNDPVLFTFYRGSNGSTSYSTECSTESTDFPAKYVGSGPLPVLGDRIYDASYGTPFNGNNKYYVISDTYQTSPSSSNTYAKIDEDGIIQEIGTCGCSEVDPPEIIQDDLELIVGQPVYVQINATNNPDTWNIISDYKRYSVTGGTKGSIWTITNLDATTTNVVVNIQETVYVSSNIDPILAFGDGVYSEVAVDQSDLLPKGLSFDVNTGLLSGTPLSTSDYSIVLAASNCVGTSAATTVNVSVTTGIKLTPFAVDVENFEDTDTAACAISPIYSLLYHNGTASLPDVKDIIYIDYRAKDPFMGGSRWYNMDNSTYAIQIDELGNVIGRTSCAIP
jgi:hypothetical protein